MPALTHAAPIAILAVLAGIPLATLSGDSDPSASARGTFYVSTSGSNSNPGTQDRPWRTIQAAVNRLRPGQRALVRAGVYREDVEVRRAGRRSARIVVAAYPGERPVLRSAGGHPLEIGSSGRYFRFRGFIVEGHPGTSGGNIDVYGSHIEISRNIVRGGRDQGIYTAEESDHVQILRNRIHHNGAGIEHQSHGIYLQGDDHVVANNLIYDHPEGFGIQVYDAGSRARVLHNTIIRSGHSGIVVGGSGGVDHVVARNNIFAFNAKWGIQHDSDCPSASVADHNLIHGNRWGAVQRGCSGLSTRGGNRSGPPRFADLDARDLHLRRGSAAIGAGHPRWSTRVDFAGERRPRGGRPDAGAYEDG